MTVIPSQNMSHIRDLVQDELQEHARPDYRQMNRWYVISLKPGRDARQDRIEALSERLQDAGYKVSRVGDDVKVTKPGLDWPDVEPE
ncbi:hypothetical protein [Halobacterium salinarum]|uniref:hypothetical protein n=1 Tax=Halobacterium salinarum TaxID=2242 RepID=UPI001F27896A|nr:hypothetical protein [Halobacterium salinarum]MCF2165424.1 hypothetical protein [Halobacterium salinarum]MCF2168290.1 hypothetical protein [Halobacterium salinarum]